MSENLIIHWAESLDEDARARVRARLLGSPGLPSSAVVAAYADAVGLSVSEVSGLLPDVLPQARVAARRLLAGRVDRPSILGC